MASPFQQQSLIRKVIYLGVIIGLFSGSWVWRRYDLEPRAKALAALEENQGEVDLSGAAIRLTLTGSRGAVTCYLWMSAIEKQKKHQWNELESMVRTLTKLQPHFITPWLFQSWNLTYNVVVESDRVNDKYYYVSRGIELLAEGERQNRNYPDLRYNIGLYTQHKICQSDETNVMRSLLQLSSIPPNERDPNRFYVKDAQGRRTLNLKEFEQFCQAHPQLVRRLQQGLQRETDGEDYRQLKCPTPEAVVQFLTDHRRIPALYQDREPEPSGGWQRQTDKLRPFADRFPLLPPPVGSQARPKAPDNPDWQAVPFDPGALTYDLPFEDYHNGYAVARAWYGYAQEPIPPPDDKIPGKNKAVVDRIRQRLPKYMDTILFRHYPARAESYTAERLQQEGWFDNQGWEIPTWFGNRSVVVGNDARLTSQAAWEQAFKMWKEHGEANHMLFSAEAETNLMQQADAFTREYHLPPGVKPEDLRPDTLTPELQSKLEAYLILTAYKFKLNESNFTHHYQRSRIEQEPVTVAARKAFYRAKALHLNGDDDDALAEYEKPEALDAWKNKVLLGEGHKEFRRDAFIMEETCNVQLRYLALVNKQLKPIVNRLCDFVPLMPKTENVFADWIITKGPFDVLDDEKQPLIPDSILDLVLNRKRTANPNAKVPSASKGPEKP